MRIKNGLLIILVLIISTVFTRCGDGTFLDIVIGDNSTIVTPEIPDTPDTLDTLDTLDTTPPTTSTLAITAVHKTDMTVSFGKASDDRTSTENLEYKLIQSLSDNINDINTAEANGTTVIEWTKTAGFTFPYWSDAIIHEETIRGLTTGQHYYFNVLVRDGAGNVSSYGGCNFTATYGLSRTLEPMLPLQAGDFFGRSISMSADGSYIAVGAPGDDITYGSAYVFINVRGPGFSYSGNRKLTASDGARGDYFGERVVISADGSTIAVAKRTYPDTNINTGAVYVFTKQGDYWNDATEDAILTASGTSVSFGYDMSISSDGSTIIVMEEGHGNVYIRPAGGWVNATENANLSSSNGVDNYGISSICSDGSVIAIGTRYCNDLVSVFIRPAGGWTDATTENALLTASDSSYFLYSNVSISSDGSTVVVGLDTSTSNANEGIACIFVKPAGGWINATENARLIISDSVWGFSGVNFTSISADGSSILLTLSMTNDAHLYLFTRPASGWTDTRDYLKIPLFFNSLPSSFSSISMSSDASIIVGGRHGVNSGQGAVYILE